MVEEQDIGDNEQPGTMSTHILIFAINLTKFYYDVYTERGILLRKVNFKKSVDKYGIPIQVSNDG